MSLPAPEPQHPSADSLAVHNFARDIQLLAGQLDFLSTSEIRCRMVTAARHVPDNLGPLAYWAVRGLAARAVERITCSRGGGADPGTLLAIFQAPTTGALSAAVGHSLEGLTADGQRGCPRVLWFSPRPLSPSSPLNRP
jgi:hypothetical protein